MTPRKERFPRYFMDVNRDTEPELYAFLEQVKADKKTGKDHDGVQGLLKRLVKKEMERGTK